METGLIGGAVLFRMHLEMDQKVVLTENGIIEGEVLVGVELEDSHKVTIWFSKMGSLEEPSSSQDATRGGR